MARKLQITLGLISAVVLIGVFQNCGANQFEAGGIVDSTVPSSQKVIGDAGGVHKITYVPFNSRALSNPTPMTLKLDLELGELSLVTSGSAKSCSLDPTRLQAFRSLLIDASVCVPAPLPSGLATCMAVGVEDIELDDGTNKTMLRPVVCHNGVFLCDGKDASFRAALDELKANPPAACLP